MALCPLSFEGFWVKINSFENLVGGDITFFENNYYIGRRTPDYRSTVYKSKDFRTWEDTNLNVGQINKVTDLTWVFSEPSYIFGAVINKGLYRYEVTNEGNHVEPFLRIWLISYHHNELISKISILSNFGCIFWRYWYIFYKCNETNKFTLYL